MGLPDPTQENSIAPLADSAYCPWPRDGNIERVVGSIECPRCGRETPIFQQAAGWAEPCNVVARWRQSWGVFWVIESWGPEIAECECGAVFANVSCGFTPDRWIDLTHPPEALPQGDGDAWDYDDDNLGDGDDDAVEELEEALGQIFCPEGLPSRD